MGRIRVEGGTEAQKKVFYTGLYHALIHPNVLSDVNGEYPAMESAEIRTAEGNRYTCLLYTSKPVAAGRFETRITK